MRAVFGAGPISSLSPLCATSAVDVSGVMAVGLINISKMVHPSGEKLQTAQKADEVCVAIGEGLCTALAKLDIAGDVADALKSRTIPNEASLLDGDAVCLHAGDKLQFGMPTSFRSDIFFKTLTASLFTHSQAQRIMLLVKYGYFATSPDKALPREAGDLGVSSGGPLFVPLFPAVP